MSSTARVSNTTAPTQFVTVGDNKYAYQHCGRTFAHPDEVGNGKYLPLVGDFLSFNEIVDTLNRQGHQFSFKRVPTEVFAASFYGAAEAAEMSRYFETYTYLGSDSYDRIALANQIAGQQPTRFAEWARMNFPALAA